MTHSSFSKKTNQEKNINRTNLSFPFFPRRIRKARINVLPAQVTPTPTKKSFLQSWATSAPFARSGASTSKTGAQGLVKPAVVQPSPKPVSGAAAVPNFGSNSAFMNTLGRRISAQSNTTPAQTMLILQLIYDAFREAFPGVPLPAIPFT